MVVKVNAIAATIWVPISWFTLNGAISPDYMASVFAIITVPWAILLVWLLRPAGNHLSQNKETYGPEALAGFCIGAGVAYYSLNVGIFSSVMGLRYPRKCRVDGVGASLVGI